MKLSYKEQWSEFTQLVLDSIDIQETCESWGLVFTGKQSAAGWAECHAANREDSHASAAVNLATGYYRDLGPGPSHPLFRLGAEVGPYATYHECLLDIAKQNKLSSKVPKSKSGRSFYDQLKWKRWNPVACRNLCKELKIEQEVLQLCGGTMAATNTGDMAIAFPIYDVTHGFDAPQKGMVCINANGGSLNCYRGKGKPNEMRRTNSYGSSGILNKHAIQHWANAAVIYKVEGISDMLALQGLIPPHLRDKHLVVTNSDGCDSLNTANDFGDLARNRNIVIIHDADEPGQFGNSGSKTGGAARWEACCIRGGAKRVVNLQLPYEVAPRKGKDLRDWINEGHTYEDLVNMVKETPVTQVSAEMKEEIASGTLLEHQIILKELNLIVLGHTKDGKILVFNGAACRKFTIPDIDRFSYAKQLVHIGKAATELIADPTDHEASDELIDSNDVRVAIAREAGGKELSRTNTVGVGMWESGGRMFAVGAGEWIAVNGGVDVYTSPMVDEKIVDFGESEEEWYNTDLLFEYLEQAKSPEWRVNHLNELAEIFGRWENHTHPIAGTIMACLVIGTWAQSIWDWRPWIAVTGESSTGKTALMEFLAEYFGKLCVPTSNASEAGIRNTIGTSSRILMLDEFEGSRHRTAIIEMLMSSNRRGRFGASLRSNAAQGSVTSEYQLMPWFSATEMKRDRQTEVNRYITFELGSREGMSFFKIPNDPEELSELRNKSIAVIMRTWKRVKELTTHIIESMDDEYSRQSESYALVSAIYAAIHGHEEERAARFHKDLIDQLRAETVIEEEDSEQELALNSILESTVQVGGGKQATVGELLQTERQEGWDADPDKILRTIGIRRVGYSEVQTIGAWQKAKQDGNAFDSGYVYFTTSPSGQIRRRLLKGTQHERMDLTTILRRIPGAFRCHLRVNGRTRGVMIPLSVVDGADSKPFPAVEMEDFTEI